MCCIKWKLRLWPSMSGVEVTTSTDVWICWHNGCILGRVTQPMSCLLKWRYSKRFELIHRTSWSWSWRISEVNWACRWISSYQVLVMSGHVRSILSMYAKPVIWSLCVTRYSISASLMQWRHYTSTIAADDGHRDRGTFVWSDTVKFVTAMLIPSCIRRRREAWVGAPKVLAGWVGGFSGWKARSTMIVYGHSLCKISFLHLLVVILEWMFMLSYSRS